MKKLVINNKEISYVESDIKIEKSIEDQIIEKKTLLEKYKEDVEQVELFGMDRPDYIEKKQMCRQLILDLRQLEKHV